MIARTRRLLGITLAVLLVLGVGAVALAEHRGWPMLRAPLERSLTDAAGVPVRLGGNFRLDLVTGSRIAVQELYVGAADGVEVPHLVNARDVAIDWRWADLWHWWRGTAPLTFTGLSAAMLDAHLVRLADGRASWRLGARRPAERAEDGGQGIPRVHSLALQRGLLQWRDARMNTELDVAVAGGDSAAGGDAAGYRAQIKGRYRDLPLDLEVHSGGVLPLLAATAESGETPPLKVRVQGLAGAARVAFDGSAAALLQARRLDGNIRISGPSLAQVAGPFGLTLPQTPAFSLSGRLLHDGASRWSLTGTQARIGSSAFGGDFELDRNAQPPHLKAQVRGSRLALRDLGPAVGVGAAAAAAKKRVLPERPFELTALRAMDADANLAFDELDFDSEALGAFRQVRAQLRLDKGVLQLTPFSAQVAGGQVRGTSRLDGTQVPARWVAKLDLQHIDIAGWVRGVRKGDAAPPPKDAAKLAKERRQARQQGDAPRSYITGVLDVDIDAQGTGVSTASILGSLDGTARVRLRDGTLSHLVTEGAGLDIAQALGVAMSGDEALPLRCGLLDLKMKDGRVDVSRGVLDNRDSTILIGGRLSLRDESLELVARARPKDATFASLRSPVTVTGPFNAPRVGIQAPKVAGRVIGAVVLGAVVAPVAALLPLIDLGDRPKSDPCA
jgi:uncharacterized protein involved in outer membrane biogenesis